MVLVGHLTLGSKSEAEARAGATVMCLDCLAPAVLKLVDYGFDDQFGGVTDWRVETDCCGNTDPDTWRFEGCDGCGEMVALSKYGDNLFCEECLARAREEDKLNE